MSAWTKQTKWVRHGKDFAIEILHIPNPTGGSWEFGEENRWFIYAYIYPKHPLAGKITSNEIFQDSLMSLPLHGGCSYVNHNCSIDGKINSIKIGCDYQHYGDEYYSDISVDDPKVFFVDALRLFDALSGKNEDIYS